MDRSNTIDVYEEMNGDLIEGDHRLELRIDYEDMMELNR